MRLLRNHVRDYAWGAVNGLAAAVGSEPTGRPEAELWVGTHPGAPSVLADDPDDRSLAELVASDPGRWLGAHRAADGETALPFLLKVLAIGRPLSLQAHPSASQAAAGFAREEAAGIADDAPERTYHDPNPKPEALVALTELWALCGFRDPSEAASHLANLGVDGLAPAVDFLRSGDLAGALAWLLRRPASERAALASSIARSVGSPLLAADPVAGAGAGADAGAGAGTNADGDSGACGGVAFDPGVGVDVGAGVGALGDVGLGPGDGLNAEGDSGGGGGVALVPGGGADGASVDATDGNAECQPSAGADGGSADGAGASTTVGAAATVDAKPAVVPSDPSDPRAWVARIAAEFPGDPLAVAPLILNLVHLAPGEAVHLPAGNLHAYLAGTGVELMAASDNVLRGGLTPKYVDVDELLAVLRFEPGVPPAPEVRAVAPSLRVYDAGEAAFGLVAVDLSDGPVEFDPLGPSLLLATGGEVDVAGPEGGLSLDHGDAAFVSPGEGPLVASGLGRLWWATTGGDLPG